MFDFGEGDPNGAVVGDFAEVGAEAGHGTLAIVAFEECGGGVEEIFGTAGDEFGDTAEGEGGHGMVVVCGVGEGERFEDIDAVPEFLFQLGEEGDGALDLSGVEVGLGGTNLLIERRFGIPARREEEEEQEGGGHGPPWNRTMTPHNYWSWTNNKRFTQCNSVKRVIYWIGMLCPLVSGAAGSFWGFEGERAEWDGLVWEAELGGGYGEAVELLLQAFEAETGKRLEPGERGKAGIKLYCNSGLGLHTPRGLTRAVLEALRERGFADEDLLLVDAREALLRECGYLPPHSQMAEVGPYFDGVRVYALDSGELQSETWYYDSPLPREFTTPLGRALLERSAEMDGEEARRSYLPDKLLVEVDFWINLPMVSHHPAVGLSGALANASLWNITNGTRFFNSPANAPVAVAEIAAIPELQDTWALSLLSLETVQYIGGPAYNANYTVAESRLWCSVDPAVMDGLLLRKVNAAREARGFERLASIPPFLEYAMELGLGRGLPGAAELKTVGAGKAEAE